MELYGDLVNIIVLAFNFFMNDEDGERNILPTGKDCFIGPVLPPGQGGDDTCAFRTDHQQYSIMLKSLS